MLSVFSSNCLSWVLSLTFDDFGPTQSTTAPAILDKAKINGTFYVTGNFINNKNINRLKKISDNGHEIGNHSLTHNCNMSINDFANEILENNKKI